MWRGNHASPVVRLQRLCMLPLCLLKPCHHHMNKPRPACWRMRQYEEEMPDIPAENIWGQSIFSQSFKMWEGLEPQSYSAANHRCMSTMEARQRKHPHYLKMHDWEGMLTVSNPWILGDISTVFPDSNLICFILATRIISSKHKLDHNILLNIQQWFRFQSLYRARVLKKSFSWPDHCLPLCFPLWLSPHSLFWNYPELLRVCTLPQLCALVVSSAQNVLLLAIHLVYSSSSFRSWLKCYFLTEVFPDWNSSSTLPQAPYCMPYLSYLSLTSILHTMYLICVLLKFFLI